MPGPSSSAEPRFQIDSTENGRYIFVCHNLNQIIPGTGEINAKARGLTFRMAVDWCAEHFGDEASIWHHTARCVIFWGKHAERNALAFRMRWGG